MSDYAKYPKNYVLRDKTTKKIMGAVICYDYFDCKNIITEGIKKEYQGFKKLSDIFDIHMTKFRFQYIISDF